MAAKIKTPDSELINQKFGRLTIIGMIPFITKKRRFAIVKCDCSKEFKADLSAIKLGNTTSCGCSRIKHGHASGIKKTTRTYEVWKNMMARCYRKKNKDYKNYGARGIKVCEGWHDFKNFLSDIGESVVGLELDRKRNEEDYSKENCKWSTRSQNMANTRAKNKLGIKGVTKLPCGKYYARIFYKKKVISLGSFVCPIVAGDAFKNKHTELYGF